MRLEATPKQLKFFEKVLGWNGERPHKYVLYGGAVGGGKTYAALMLLFLLCKVFPGSRWGLVRKDLPTLKRNTLPSFYKIRPEGFVGDINKSDWTCKCANGSEIVIFPEGIREDPDLDRWKGLEVNGFILEEAGELSEKTFHMAMQRSGRWTVEGEQPLPYVIATCNPTKNWIKRMFYDRWKLGSIEHPWAYVPATKEDNPHLDPEYKASLEHMKEVDPIGYQRFVLGDWDVADDPEQLITWEMVAEAFDLPVLEGKQSLGVDVARYGGDRSVIARKQGNAIVDVEVFVGRTVDQVADLAQARILELSVEPKLVGVDSVGLGAGVVDILVSRGLNVTEVKSGGRAEDFEVSAFDFKNLRSQMWHYFRELLRRKDISLARVPQRYRQELLEDLTSPKYWINADRVLEVEGKDKIRKRLGRSTDVGDAVIYAAFVQHIGHHWLVHWDD